MCKTKKLVSRIASIAASAIFCTASITSVSTNAYIGLDKSSDEYIGLMSDYYEVNDSGIWNQCSWNGTTYEPYKVYASKTNPTHYLYEIINAKKCFSFVVPTDKADYSTVVKEILDSVDPSYEINVSYQSDLTDGTSWASYTVTDKKLNSESVKNARRICSELKEKGLVKSFYYSDDISSPAELRCNYLTEYKAVEIQYDEESKKLVWVEKPEVFDKLEKYIEENGLDCSLVKVETPLECDSDGNPGFVYRVVPNTEITIEEHFELAKQIMDNLGLSNEAVILESVSPSYATTIDLFNAVYGDATNNGKIDLYDAIETAKSILGVRTFTEKEKVIADINNDGVVDLLDVVEIAEYINKK